MIGIGRKKPGSSRLFAPTPQRQKRENTGLPRSQASVVWRTSAATLPQGEAFLRLEIYQGLHVHAVSSPLLPAFALYSPRARRMRFGLASGGRAGLGTTRGVSRIESRREHACA